MPDIVYDGRTYFTDSELRCKGSGQLLLAPGFAEQLLKLRLMYEKPMPVISACRSLEYNEQVGGARGSYHICDTGRGCCAVDVTMENGQDRARLVRLALASGWSVGIKPTMLHLDLRNKYQPYSAQVLFLYTRKR